MKGLEVQFSSVQSLSHALLLATPWTATSQASLSFSISWRLLKLLSVDLRKPSRHLILCRPLLLLPSIFPGIRVFFPMSQVFASGGQRIGASALASVPSNEYSGLKSFWIDWFDLLVVQVTLKNLSSTTISIRHLKPFS